MLVGALRSSARLSLSPRSSSAPRAQARRLIATAAAKSLSSSSTLVSTRSRQLVSSAFSARSVGSIGSRMSSSHAGESAVRGQPDKVLTDIADYVHDFNVDSELAWFTARLCLIGARLSPC